MWQQKSPLQVYELGRSCKSILKIMAVCHVNLDFWVPDGSCCFSKQFPPWFPKKKKKIRRRKKEINRRSLLSLMSHIGTRFCGSSWCWWDTRFRNMLPESLWGSGTQKRCALRIGERLFILRTSQVVIVLARTSSPLYVESDRAGCWELGLLKKKF